MLKPQHVSAYRDIHEKLYGVTISESEAYELGIQLITLIEAVLSPNLSLK